MEIQQNQFHLHITCPSHLQIACPVHPSEKLDFINFTQQNRSPLICFCCARKKRIPANEMIKMSEILNAEDQTLLTFFPPLRSNEVWDELIEVYEDSLSVETVIEKIESFVKQLTKEINGALQMVNQNAKLQIVQLLASKEKMNETYNQIASKAQIKELLLNTKQKDDLCDELQKILTDKMNEKQDNSKKIELVMAEHKQLVSQLSFDIPNKLKQTALRMIEKVNFFSGVNEEQFQEIIGDSRLGIYDENETKKGKTNANMIIDLINSKANFCSDDFQEKIKKAIKNVQGLLNDIEFGDSPFDQNKRNTFQNLNSDQMDKIIQLSQKIAEKNTNDFAKSNMLNSSFLSNKSKSTCFSTQDQSFNFSVEGKSSFFNQKALENEQSKSQFGLYQEEFRQEDHSQNVFELLEDKISSEDERKVLKDLLNNYPIFQMANIHFERQLMKSITFIPAQNQLPSQIELSYGPQFICINSIGQQSHKLAYCDFKLNPDKKYVFRVSIQKNIQTKDTHFLFGLIPEQDKDSKLLSKGALSYSEFSNSFGMSTVIKGKNLHRGYQNGVNRQFEMRIHLREKLMRVADYPGYQNVCTLDNPNSLSSDQEYRFATEFFYLNDSFMINQISEVANFNNQM